MATELSTNLTLNKLQLCLNNPILSMFSGKQVQFCSVELGDQCAWIAPLLKSSSLGNNYRLPELVERERQTTNIKVTASCFALFLSP